MASVRAGEVYRHNLHEYWSSEVYDCVTEPGCVYDSTELIIEAGTFVLSKLKLVNETAEQTITYTNGQVVN